MSERPTPTASWEDMSGRERVRAVVETMGEPMSVIEIADESDVSRSTADSELDRLASQNRVRPVLVDDKKGYQLNHVSLLFDEIQQLIEENTQVELGRELADLKERREQLEAEYSVSSLEMFREQMVEEEDLSADELRERQNVAATLEALDTELKLVRHALRLHQDVSELEARTNSPAAPH